MVRLGNYGIGTGVRAPGVGGINLATAAGGEEREATSMLGQAASMEATRMQNNERLEQQEQAGNAALGATAGAVAGASFGPIGMMVGGLIGGIAGGLF